MKSKRTLVVFFLCLVVLIGCSKSKESAQDKLDSNSKKDQINTEIAKENNIYRSVDKIDYINDVYGEGYTRVEAYQDLFDKLGYDVKVTERILLELNNMKFSEHGYYALLVTHNFPTDYIESSTYDSSNNKYLYRVSFNKSIDRFLKLNIKH